MKTNAILGIKAGILKRTATGRSIFGEVFYTVLIHCTSKLQGIVKDIYPISLKHTPEPINYSWCKQHMLLKACLICWLF